MYIAWRREEGSVEPKKLTYKEEVEIMAAHLREKWERDDRIKAEKKYGIKKRLMSTSALHNQQS
jgi:hypothetical protein